MENIRVRLQQKKERRYCLCHNIHDIFLTKHRKESLWERSKDNSDYTTIESASFLSLQAAAANGIRP